MTREEFWPFYVSQHLNPTNRKLHFVGTTFGLLCLLDAAVDKQYSFLLAGLLGSYGAAWVGHFFYERNAPATFKYPLLSLQADFKMYALMWRGKMEEEVARIGGKKLSTFYARA